MTQQPVRHPVVVAHLSRRADDLQLRIADAITAFAGSMPFVYLHAVAFAGWMLFLEFELRANTELTRAVHVLTKDLHDRLLADPAPR